MFCPQQLLVVSGLWDVLDLMKIFQLTFPIIPDQHFAHTEYPVLMPRPCQSPDQHLLLLHTSNLAGEPHVGAEVDHVLPHSLQGRHGTH